MEQRGYGLLDVSLAYRGRRGVDLVFRKGENFAIVEAKAGKDLGTLRTYSGLRQGSMPYNVSRLDRYVKYLKSGHDDLARTLLAEGRRGSVESYATFYRGGSVYQLPVGWPTITAIRQ